MRKGACRRSVPKVPFCGAGLFINATKGNLLMAVADATELADAKNFQMHGALGPEDANNIVTISLPEKAWCWVPCGQVPAITTAEYGVSMASVYP